jgi:hypothetical protein
MNDLFSADAIPRGGPAGTIKAPDWLLKATLGNLSASIAQKPG